MRIKPTLAKFIPRRLRPEVTGAHIVDTSILSPMIRISDDIAVRSADIAKVEPFTGFLFEGDPAWRSRVTMMQGETHLSLHSANEIIRTIHYLEGTND